MILIPIKDLSNAKQRLSPAMEQSERTRLARAMLLDVLDAVHSYGRVTVSLVTSDPFAMEAAKHYAFDVIPDKLNLSESDAIAMATEVCQSRGIESTLVIPGDIPLIEASEIQAIYDCAPKRGSVLVPSGDKRGSNALFRNPAALFPLRFGNDSFMPHLIAAIATNATCIVLSLPGIRLDIDTPEDLARLAAARGNTRAQVLARGLTATKAGSFDSVNSDLVRPAK
jgi:2-phospho-L-lactate guanylyltransferase